jgi:hypothetical protein
MDPMINADGWRLVSAEDRNEAYLGTFEIPFRKRRETLVPGEGAKLIFDVETRKDGGITDREIHRMWVIVKARVGNGYTGILDSDPSEAGIVRLQAGDIITFEAEHIADVDNPPREYLIEKYGTSIFGE